MKLRLINAFLMLVVACMAFAQGKNPKIMVVPMDTWCQERGFWNVYENQGEIKGTPNYEQAVQDSRELMLVISKINNLMSDRGFPLLTSTMRHPFHIRVYARPDFQVFNLGLGYSEYRKAA